MPQIVLNVTLIGQQTDMWCWAASGEMIMSYEGTNVAQCAQANWRFGMNDCCDNPTPGACVQGGWPDFGHWGFNSQTTSWGVALSFADLTAQMNSGQPVAFSWGWAGGGGHMMVAGGVDTDTNFVFVDDPWPPDTGDQRWISYTNYVSQPGVYTHWIDYYNITPTGGAGGGNPSSSTGNAMSNDPSGSAQHGHASADAAATDGLRLLPRLAERGPGAHVMGGDEPPAFGAQGQLGEPFTVVYVQRDDLADYAPGADASRLLVDPGERLYPVLGSSGEATAAIRVTRQEGAWTVKSVGEPRLVRDIVEVRDHDAMARETGLGEYLLVQVPALYKTFVGRQDAAGRLVLLPVHDDPEKGMEKAAPGAGDDLLARLVPDAQSGRSALPAEGPGPLPA